MIDSPDAPPFDDLLLTLRTAAAEALAHERAAPRETARADATLPEVRRRADAAARAILDAPASGSGARLARYEARLWLDGGLMRSVAEEPVPGPVAGSLERVDVPGLVAAVETIEGLAAVHDLALELAERARATMATLADRDADAAHAIGALAGMAGTLAAAAAVKLEGAEPTSSETARRRAAALIAHAVAKGDPHALERAGMIAMRAGLEIYELNT